MARKRTLGIGLLYQSPRFPARQDYRGPEHRYDWPVDTSRHKGDTGNYVYVVGDDKLSSDLKPISESINKKYTKLELDYKYNDPNDRQRIYFRSDHYNFADKGVPIIFYYDGMLGSDYHRPTDTPDKINYTLLAKRAQLVFYTAWEMANRNDMLKRDLKLEVPPRGSEFAERSGNLQKQRVGAAFVPWDKPLTMPVQEPASRTPNIPSVATTRTTQKRKRNFPIEVRKCRNHLFWLAGIFCR